MNTYCLTSFKLFVHSFKPKLPTYADNVACLYNLRMFIKKKDQNHATLVADIYTIYLNINCADSVKQCAKRLPYIHSTLLGIWEWLPCALDVFSQQDHAFLIIAQLDFCYLTSLVTRTNTTFFTSPHADKRSHYPRLVTFIELRYTRPCFLA